MQDTPYGLGQCGCGERTKLATKTDRSSGRIAGQPMRYLKGHHRRVTWPQPNRDAPGYGYCQCGCGQKAPVYTDKEASRPKGRTPGEPKRFIRGHNHLPPIDYSKVGYCACGCGQRTPISEVTVRMWGYVRGEPRKFVPGHHKRKSGTDYLADEVTGCWVWQRHIDAKGYGRLWPNGKRAMLAHRWVYEKHKGPIAPGLVIDHLCRNTRCVNPDHLEPVSNTTNCRRGNQAKLTEADVRTIRERASLGARSRDLAQAFGVAQHTIQGIVAGRSWVGVGEGLHGTDHADGGLSTYRA